MKEVYVYTDPKLITREDKYRTKLIYGIIRISLKADLYGTTFAYDCRM